MKVIEKIYNFISHSKKGKVIIKSEKGLPTFKSCGVVLADCGIGGGCNFQSFMPPIPDLPTETETEEETEEDSIVIKNCDKLKETILSLDGIGHILFGKAFSKKNHNCESLEIRFNPNKFYLSTLLKIYLNFSGEKEIFFNNKIQKNKILNLIENKIPVSELDHFEL